jgi:hypothetical protein
MLRTVRVLLWARYPTGRITGRMVARRKTGAKSASHGGGLHGRACAFGIPGGGSVVWMTKTYRRHETGDEQQMS